MQYVRHLKRLGAVYIASGILCLAFCYCTFLKPDKPLNIYDETSTNGNSDVSMFTHIISKKNPLISRDDVGKLVLSRVKTCEVEVLIKKAGVQVKQIQSVHYSTTDKYLFVRVYYMQGYDRDYIYAYKKHYDKELTIVEFDNSSIHR